MRAPEGSDRLPAPFAGEAFPLEGTCCILRHPQGALSRPGARRIYTDDETQRSYQGALEGPPPQGTTGLFEAEVRTNLVALDAKLREHFSELDRKLDLIALQVNGGFDSLSLSLARQAAEAAGRRRPSKGHALNRQISPDSSVGSGPARLPRGAGGGGTDAASPGRAAFSPFGPEPSGGMGADLQEEEERRQALAIRNGARRNSLASCQSKSSVGGLSSWELEFLRRQHPSKCRQAVWGVLEDPESGPVARWFARTWGPLIVIASVLGLVQTLQGFPVGSPAVAALELLLDCFFVAEAALRYSVCPNSIAFFYSAMNVIDVIAAIPIVPRFVCLASGSCDADSAMRMSLICVAPVVRLLKTLRHFRQFHLFVRLMNETSEALSVLLFLLCIIVLCFSTLIYLVEPRDNVESLPKAMYLIIVTISTVGYGDVTPATTAGTFAVSVIILCSVLYMAMPIGIVGNAFTRIWSDRDRILLTIRTRDRLTQWGYTAADMRMLFKHFDTNRNGELNLVEFRNMILEMHLGIKDDRVIELFDSFDKDGSGGIDPKEFTRTLFPSTFHELFGDTDSALIPASPPAPLPPLPPLGQGSPRGGNGHARAPAEQTAAPPPDVADGLKSAGDGLTDSGGVRTVRWSALESAAAEDALREVLGSAPPNGHIGFSDTAQGPSKWRLASAGKVTEEQGVH